MKKATQSPCRSFEDLLIWQTVDFINEEQAEKLNQHLKACTACQQFQSLLFATSSAMKIKEKTNFVPDANIRQAVIQKMTQHQIKAATFLQAMLQTIWKLLEYRIPVYQGILGIILVTCLIWGALNLPFWSQPPYRQVRNQSWQENIQLDQRNGLNTLDILEAQKVGKSVSEDTMLIKFLSPAM